MLRGSRSGDAAPVGESFSHPQRTPHELLVAVAPLPGAPEFRIAGWPPWLMPEHLGLSRAVPSRTALRPHH